MDLNEEDLQEIIADFLVEAGELLEKMDHDLVSLEERPDDKGLLNSIFRALHTIKGSASFLNLESMAKVSHGAEDVIGRLRSGEIQLDPELMDTILASVDIIKSFLTDLANKTQSKVDYLPVLKKLQTYLPEKAQVDKSKKIEETPSKPPTENLPLSEEHVVLQPERHSEEGLLQFKEELSEDKESITVSNEEEVLSDSKSSEEEEPLQKGQIQIQQETPGVSEEPALQKKEGILQPEDLKQKEPVSPVSGETVPSEHVHEKKAAPPSEEVIKEDASKQKKLDLSDEDYNEILGDFLVESGELIEKIDQDLMALEEKPEEKPLLDSVFRALHTIKGTSSFLNLENISKVSHAGEEIMGKLRNKELSLNPEIMDAILEIVDIVKTLLKDLAGKTESPIDIESILQRVKAIGTVPISKRDSEESAPSELPPQESAPSELPPQESIIQAETKKEIPLNLSDKDYKEILADFLMEGEELLEKTDQNLVSLEKAPMEKSILDNIFRSLHTIKGTSSFLGYDEIFKVSHAAEEVMGRVRSGDISPTPEIMDAILGGVDTLKKLFDEIRRNVSKTVDTNPVIERLKLYFPPLVDIRQPEEKTGDIHPEVKPDEIEEVPVLREEPETTISQQLPDIELMPRVEVPTKIPTKMLTRQVKAQTLRQEAATIRVETGRLDHLMNLAGELVLGRNRLARVVRRLANFLRDERPLGDFLRDDRLYPDLCAACDLIDFITSDIQKAVLKTRMQPVGKIFNRFTRTVRDLARECGKEVRLLIQGADTELDKTIIEEIGDPLVHLLRNAVDHGIETPDVRKKTGKDPVGTVILSAHHEGNHILITIRDDGRGIDPEKVRRKAVEKGLISTIDAQRMSDKDAINLIFTPGFSTADKVTKISGRGVGMDVVHNNIEKLKGQIELFTELGKGTSFVIRLPLTLAIIQALLVKVGGETFAIPLASVIETLRVKPSELKSVSGHEVIKFRNTIVPLLRLDCLFDITSKKPKGNDRVYIVVVGVAEKKVGIIIDTLLWQEEIVVKSLGNVLQGTTGIAGATIMGDDGRIALIVDVAGLIRLIPRYPVYSSSASPIKKQILGGQKEKKEHIPCILVVEDARTERKLTRMTLEAKGIKVIEAVDGRDALAKLDDHKIDLVITDIEMPELDGYQLTAKIRKNKRLKDIPVIAISARKEMIDRIKGMESGIDTYLPKPFREEELFSAIKNLIS